MEPTLLPSSKYLLRRIGGLKIALFSTVVLAVASAPAQTLTTLHSFAGVPGDGSLSQAALIADASGNFYGTTANGGAYNWGTVFKMTPSGTVTILHSFAGAPDDGSRPVAGLIADASGNLYGTTWDGGANGAGTVFKMTPSGTVTILHSFTGAPGDGENPEGGLVADASGNLYGTTYLGGDSDPVAGLTSLGTVFKLTPSGTLTVLHVFTGQSDGGEPAAGLIADASGNLYGTTQIGGTNFLGTVFKITPSGVLTVLHSFAGGSSDGAGPSAGLVADASGNLYGTTMKGGVNDSGTVFKLTPSGTLTMLHSFAGSPADGARPVAGLIADASGNLYGTTSLGGSANVGTVFELTASGTLTVLHSFLGGGDGNFPKAGLIADASANLYGTTAGGGTSNWGTVFKLAPTTPVTIASNTASATFSVSGTGCQPGSNYSVPQTLQWTPGSSCSVTFTSPVSGGAGTQYVFTQWADGPADNPRSIAAPASAATYTANFKTQYQLTTSSSPAGAGNVTGAGFYDAGGTAAVVATANAGYQFAGWSPALSPNTASSSVSMTAPQSVTANFALLTTVSVGAASGQYSDSATLMVTVGPAAAAFTGSLQFQVNQLNVGAPVPVSGSGVYSASYSIADKPGSYPITAVFTSTTPTALSGWGGNTLTVMKEDATITPAAGNPQTVQVSSPGGAANSIALTGTLQQAADGAPGDLSKAQVTVSLVPAISGTPAIACAVANANGSVTATCSNVPVNAYTAQWTISGDYYTGPQVNTVLAVYDPSLGFVTGSGTLSNNGVPAEFSISVKYQKDGTLSSGGVTYIEHRATGDFTVRSTVLTSMSVVRTTAVIQGQASVNGGGSYPFQLTVTDNGESGVNDTFGLQASPNVSFNPVTITSGNLQVH